MAIDPTFFTAALYGGFVALFAWQMKARRHVVLLTWPALIYMIGPAATLLFMEQPVLGRYVNPDRINAQTLQIAWYLLLLLLADSTLDVSKLIRSCLDGSRLKRLASSPAFAPIYVGASLSAILLQSYTLASVGNIFNGTYILESAAEGLIPYWGFLAGLYEIVFLCFILLLIGRRPTGVKWRAYLLLYVLTTLLRVMGGTRLILIKELAFILLLFYLRGSIKPRRLLAVGAGVVVAGSLIGLVRNGSVDESNNFLGPLYGLVMESALGALTLGIADTVNVSGDVARDGSLLGAAAFFAITVIPSFLRPGISEEFLSSLSPYSLAIRHGFDTWAPVGGMSGFATIDYLTPYPSVCLLLLVFGFALWFKLKSNDFVRQALGLVLVINAIHFWRDPADIAFKLVFQGMLICFTLFLIPHRKYLGVSKPKRPAEAST